MGWARSAFDNRLRSRDKLPQWPETERVSDTTDNIQAITAVSGVLISAASLLVSVLMLRDNRLDRQGGVNRGSLSTGDQAPVWPPVYPTPSNPRYPPQQPSSEPIPWWMQDDWRGLAANFALGFGYWMILAIIFGDAPGPRILCSAATLAVGTAIWIAHRLRKPGEPSLVLRWLAAVLIGAALGAFPWLG